MDYLELNIETNPDVFEILVAELADLGFESFTEDQTSLQAYVLENAFQDLPTKLMLEKYAGTESLIYTIRKIEKQNWNEEWEKNFEPIVIAKDIFVRAHFHAADDSFKHQIIITPKMSFGTGHHETTSMVMGHQLNIDHTAKSVLDVGCGTGILAILAEKLGANRAVAFDNDEWCVENTQENLELNHCAHCSVNLGTIETQEPSEYDIVLANINRNILLAQIPIYKTFMKPGAYLVVSGFYEKDMADIQTCAETAGLRFKDSAVTNQWASLVFVG